MSTQSEYVIDRFGGTAAMARVVGRAPSVVQGWKERGTIPARHYPRILEGGCLLSPPFTAEELIQDRDGQRHIMAEDAA